MQLIVPDKQLYRIGHPHIVIPELRGRLFYFDEANVSWCPDTGRVYRVMGEQAKIDSPGQNETWYILGSLEYPTGSGLYEIYDHKTNVQIRSHWQQLLNMYPDDFLVDNQDRLCLVPLPTHSPHLNLIERLWDYMRDNITRSVFYETLDKLCQALVAWLYEIPFQRFWSLMGVP